MTIKVGTTKLQVPPEIAKLVKKISIATEKAESVVKEAKVEARGILADAKKGRKPRVKVEMPSRSLYTFNEGDKVCVEERPGQWENGYTYARRAEKMHIIKDVKGKEYRAWFTKVAPHKEMKKLNQSA